MCNIIKTNNVWHDLEFKEDDRSIEYIDDIYLIQQFFIHSDDYRYKEIQYCLRRNINNFFFKKIILLNERIYSNEELGLSDEEFKRVKQVNIGHRMKYKDVLEYVYNEKLNGYIVFSNSDIYFNDTIKKIYRTTLFLGKCWYAQLRIEAYTKRLYGPNAHAQDTWIFHSKCRVKQLNNLDFILGKLGCDNKLPYELATQGIYVYNQPLYINTFHLHKSIKRDYNLKDRLKPPYLRITPLLK